MHHARICCDLMLAMHPPQLSFRLRASEKDVHTTQASHQSWCWLQVEEDPTGGKYAGAGSALNGAAHKLENIIQFHVGDVVTSLQRAVMQPGGQEAVLYGTIMGGIGMPMFDFGSSPSQIATNASHATDAKVVGT